jgi:hypothetical protein
MFGLTLVPGCMAEAGAAPVNVSAVAIGLEAGSGVTKSGSGAAPPLAAFTSILIGAGTLSRPKVSVLTGRRVGRKGCCGC